METKKFKNQMELALFINLKAKEGFTEVRVAHGAYTSRLDVKEFVQNQTFEYPIEVELGTHGKDQLIIGDIF